MCSRIKSSFNGKIQEIPGIAVDNFEGDNLKSRAFFLSHCHSDHTKGLFSPELLDTLVQHKVFIYMHDLSAAIVADDCGHDERLLSYIRPLSIGTTHITLPGLFGHEETCFRVTLIHAGHCLGSVMFLFETNNQNILYTGDFNISSNDICNYSAFHDKKKEPIKIDAMYIDTTFISWDYDYFPKRSTVIEDLVAMIKEWLNSNEKNRVSLSVSAKYGYEYVFNEIFKKLGEKVYVNEERMAFYRAHPGIANGVTSMETETRIHNCSNRNEGDPHKWCSISQTSGYNFLLIRFSAMRWDKYEFEGTAIRRPTNNRVEVCYATHCSRTQIITFVDYFSPKKVVGFPNPYIPSSPHKKLVEVDVNSIQPTPIKRKIESPKSRKSKIDRKVDKRVLKRIFDI